MKTRTVIWLIVATLLIISGTALGAATLSVIDWDFSKLGTADMQTNRHEIAEDFGSISIVADIEDIRILPSTDNTATAVFEEDEKQRHSATVIDGTLSISADDTREWYEKIGIFSTKGPTITLYLPNNSYNALSINSDTSDIFLPKDFTFNSIEIKNSTGDIECFSTSTGLIKITASTGDIEMTDTAAGALELTTTTGDMEIENITCTGDIKIAVTTGEAELSNITCSNLYSIGDTGDIELENVIAQGSFNITRTTGDVGLETCDAAEITVVTDTGDVSGSLLGEKIYITSSNTGRIRVPQTTSGGKCQITTDTGNIIFSMHNS
ncbi:MAG: DUF4097 family beta strand repeat-containing protein [Acutalibacteraceae bacterium]|nr:DUF4097 family beta strand repeat-containing protein [Acutalibacteraceae bacterium]